MRTATLVLLLLVSAVPAAAQNVISPPPRPTVASLAGPRFGVTMLPDAVVSELREHNIELRQTISQFGWQFEKQFYAKDSGVGVLNEWVVMVGGLDQGVALPSLSWMVGMRTANGTEFGAGPNVSASGVGLVLAAGTTLRAGFLNIPVNFAVVPSRQGTRISFLTGFSVRKS